MGNLRHLIVEACIARNLLDTSAYFWPGYVSARSSQVLRNVPGQMPGQVPGWSSIMKGSPLTPSLVNALVATPASRYAANCITTTCVCVCVYFFFLNSKGKGVVMTRRACVHVYNKLE